jgi:serine/threonine-protein kinase
MAQQDLDGVWVAAAAIIAAAELILVREPVAAAYRVCRTAAAAEADVNEDGTPFGRYRLVELLGRGGMGEVWRAHDTATDRVVAIKVLPQHLADDETFKTRFRREAHSAARLDSPHVVPIHDYGEIDGRLYVTMRLIKGRDLQTILADGPLSPARAVRIIEQVGRALHAAHKIGLVHRDVKPSNILLDEDDYAYLIDFGIARAAEDTKLTSTGSMIGTLQYLAPERLRRGEVDARADIYALACVLYECLTGSPPFPGDSAELLMMAHLSDPPPQPSSAQPDVPEQFDEVIAIGMAKDPDQRYATTVELATAAQDAITTPIPRPSAVPPQPAKTTEPVSASTADMGATVIEPENVEDQAASARSRPREHEQSTDPTVVADRKLPTPEMSKSAPSTDPSVAATEQADWTNQPPTQLAPTGPTGPLAPPKEIRARRLSQRAKIALIGGAVALVVVIAAAVGIPAIVGHKSSPAGQSSRPSQSSQPSQAAPPSPYGPQVVLPFTDLQYPDGLAVDTTGSVYVSGAVTTTETGHVLKLAAGTTTPTELPFAGLKDPSGVAVDTAGSVYVADTGNSRVLRLPAGANTPTPLPFTGLHYPYSVAVNSAGNVYVADHGNNRVLMLAAGGTTPTELPFGDINYLDDVAADSAGNVYITDHGNNRVLRLATGAASPTVLRFSALSSLVSVAVDAAGSVYVTDAGANRVLMLAAGGTTPTELPFAGLREPRGVAVDSTGSVYVADFGNNRIVKLPRAPSP